MLQVLLIVMFVSVYLRDELPRVWLREVTRGVPDWQLAAWAVGSMIFTAAATHAFVWFQGRRLDRTGLVLHVRRAEDALIVGRMFSTALHVFNILALGWIDTIRHAIGNLVAIDEILACLPVLGVFIAGWWSFYPIDRRLRESVIIHEFDHGRAMPPMPTRGAFVLAAVRHQMSIILAPIVCILTWGEFMQWGVQRHHFPQWADQGPARFAGTVLILILLPAALRHVWDTIALEPGPLRDRLLEMCRVQRVRVRELLIWRTHGTMINGAVMGLIPPLRYILLTDALIENLPPEQVEAVTAHELGHVRRRHILWLAAAAIGSIITFSVGAELALELLGGGLADTAIAQGAIGFFSLAAGISMFGFVSRRFEWQADAFAVQHLSGHRPGSKGIALSPEAVNAMSGALNSVAVLNHIPKNRFTWRHGSIATRQRRLAALVGLPADRLPIDRQARLLILLSAAAGMVAAGLMLWASVSSPPRSSSPQARSKAALEHGGCWCDLSRCMGSATTTSTSTRTPIRS